MMDAQTAVNVATAEMGAPPTPPTVPKEKEAKPQEKSSYQALLELIKKKKDVFGSFDAGQADEIMNILKQMQWWDALKATDIDALVKIAQDAKAGGSDP